MNIDIKCGDRTIHAYVNNEGSYVSRHTGKTLQSLGIIFDALNDDQRDWAQAFSSSGATVETDGTEHKQWRIGENDSMQTVGQPGGRFTWELLEVESLQPEALIIDGWELKPYKYKETFFFEDNLEIIARVEVTREEKDRIRDMAECLQVVRKGIQDEPREMRFGPCLWSQSGENFRIGLRLIDKKYDAKDRSHGFNEPRESNMTARTIRTSMELNGLFDLLIAKGVLSQADVDQIQNLDRKHVNREVWSRDYVQDLDEWLDREGD
jgi:hypothetical protein